MFMKETMANADDMKDMTKTKPVHEPKTKPIIANKTPCRSLPQTATKEELKVAHRQKMELKKQVLKHEAERAKHIRYFHRANLSKDHPKHGLSPQEAY